MYSYKLTDEIGAILWKFVDTSDSLEDLIDYPKNIFYEEFRYDELHHIVNNLKLLKLDQ